MLLNATLAYGMKKHLGHHRAVIDKMLGLGFRSGKTLRTHIADWVLKIQDAYPDDTLKRYSAYRGAR